MPSRTVAFLLAATLLAPVIIATIPLRRAWAQADVMAPPDKPSSGTGAGVEGETGSGAAGGAPTSTEAQPAPTTGAISVTRPVASGASGSSSAPPPPRMVASLSHDLQLGVAILIGDGYRGIFPYQTMIFCGDAKATDNRVCTNRAPPFIDIQPSFGLSTSWDFLVDLRFGVVKDFNTKFQFYAMPGFRYWLDPESQVKFFTTVQLAYDRGRNYTPVGAPNPVNDNDLGFRNSNGLMIEIMRNFGVYVQFGETIGFLRWLSFLVDAGVGFQARIP